MSAKGSSCLKIEHSETLFPAFLETKNQFPRQGWSSLKFSLKSKIFNENALLVGEGGGRDGNNRIFSCLSFIKMKRETNQIFRLISKNKSNVAVLKNLIALFCYPLVSKFMRCLIKKNKIKNKKNPQILASKYRTWNGK